MTLTRKIMNAIEGTSYMGTTGLGDYHAAQAVKSALRCKASVKKLTKIREALRQYRVCVWLRPEGHIEICRDGCAVISFAG